MNLDREALVLDLVVLALSVAVIVAVLGGWL